MAQFGFIGMGNMGSAMLKGALKTFSHDQIIFSRSNKEKGEQLSYPPRDFDILLCLLWA